MITNIILDMDGTLLDHDFTFTPIPRAYLAEFLTFVFAHFERVSIWTAAGITWYERCYHHVLKQHVPEGKSFHFVKTREDFDSEKVVKPLTMIYAQYPEYNPENTLIVDDNYKTFSENLDNAIPVLSFCYNMTQILKQDNLSSYDYELLDIIDILKQRLGNNETMWAFRIPLNLTLD
jgi:phosphoglycolate phosphatase-like HAD superfamily hydrolase